MTETNDFTFLQRRKITTAGFSALLLASCKRIDAPADSNAKIAAKDEHEWRKKFRGMTGGELYADAVPEKSYVTIFDEKGDVFYRSGAMSIKTNSRQGYKAQFGVPISLRATWRDDEPNLNAPSLKPVQVKNGDYSGGVLLGDVTVPVAERIPDELLDRMRKYNGSFILKLRLTDETLLIGWEVKFGKGYPWAVDLNKSAYFRPEVDDTAGGDFCERRVEQKPVLIEGLPVNGNDLIYFLPDWIRDKKTGQKIETGF
jgi:hypothetical protein